MPSIEFWFLLHYLETNRYFKNSADVSKVLQKYIKDYEKTGKFLSNPEWVKRLLSDGKMDIASQRAEKFGTSGVSYSNIYKAIKCFSQHILSSLP